MESAITIYTDGASAGNPGPGGFGVVLKYGNHRKEISKGYRLTTNNRMELMAVIEGMKAIKKPGATLHIFSDSQYVVNAVIKDWVFQWKRNGFKGKKNPDLWNEFLELHSRFNVRFFWVKGHAGNIENEICDAMATKALLKPDHIDEGYERLRQQGLV